MVIDALTPEVRLNTVSANTFAVALPATGFVRLSGIIGNIKATPPIPAIIPISASGWWNGVKTGKFPKPVKLGPRVTAWKAEDIRKFIDAMSVED